MKKWIIALLLIVCLIPLATQAADKTQYANGFGYGALVDLQGPEPYKAIQEAGKYHLDWIGIDFQWQLQQTDAESAPTWEQLDAAMAIAAEYHLPVMISISNAPSWAMTQNGPDANLTGQLASALVRRYSGSLLALELFPSANTIHGWGTTPNPEAYALLLRNVSHRVNQLSPDVLIISAGLTPMQTSSEGMDDLMFLRQLYANGISDFAPIISLQLHRIGSDPLSRSSQPDKYTLRHYENIRNIMTENDHKNGLIWITGFSWDEGTLNSPNDQAAWMKQAYLLFRSQLNIGAAFFDGLNPSQSEAHRLLFANTYHPGFEELIQIIAQDHNEQTINITHAFTKRLTNKSYRKAITS